MNNLKKLIFKLWDFYRLYCPINFGKHRISKYLHYIVGRAIYKHKGFLLNLSQYEFEWKRIVRDNFTDMEVYQWIDEILPDQNGVFIDIGANIGVFSLYAASKKIH